MVDAGGGMEIEVLEADVTVCSVVDIVTLGKVELCGEGEAGDPPF